MATPATKIIELPPAMIEAATAAADWVIILPVVLALMGAALLLMLRGERYGQPVLAILFVLGIAGCEVELLLRVLESGPQTMTMGKWLPPFGISFTADLLGAAFALAASAVTLVVLLYVQADIAARQIRYGFILWFCCCSAA